MAKRIGNTKTAGCYPTASEKNTIMKKILIPLFLIIPLLSTAQVKTWTADWDQLRNRPYPQWFTDAKLGIFIHWGLYSVPSYGSAEDYGEWFLRGLQLEDTLRVNFMKRTYGEDFTYRDFAPMFKAELFDPDEWADIFKRSGAGYIILVSKHHDGYCLWPSIYAPGWNSMDVGPHRNLVGELTKSVRKAGLKMGIYYSLTEWNNPLHRWYTDPNDQIKNYVDQHMIPQFKEVIGSYKPELIFTDGEWFNKASDFHAAELIAWYYNLVGPDAIVNNRWGGGSDIGFLTPEYSSGIKNSDRPWSEVRGLGRSFALNRNEKLNAYMTPKDLIHFFVKAVSHGGGITINVGPRADGQIPLLQQERILKLGEWIETNQEAIYGSKTWKRGGEEQTYFLGRLDPEINFNWVRNSPGKPIAEDSFKAVWTGFIKPDHSEEYTFEAIADDAVRVWIGDQLIINNWKNVPEHVSSQVMGTDLTESKTGKIGLQADYMYTIRIEYYEHKQNASIQLYWSSSMIEKTIVSSEYLFPTKNPLEKRNGLLGTFQSQGQYLGYTTNNGNLYAITLEWPGDKLELPDMPQPKASTKIRMLGLDRDLNWEYRNKYIIIDLSEIGYEDLPGHDAWTFEIEGLVN